MDENVNAGCLGCIVMALLFFSFAMLGVIFDSESDGGDYATSIAGLIVSIVMLVAWFFTSRD
jgi:hypothetical protein